MKYRLKFLAVLFYLIPLLGCAQTSAENSITVEELKSNMQSDSTLVLLDVRTPEELAGPLGKIEGVINIPVQVLNDKLGELEKYKDRPIAVICRSGNRSGVATKLLIENGFKAKNVLGGMKEWNTRFPANQ